jgi:hypothetical protein
MNKLFSLIFLMICIASCSQQFDGKIITNDNSAVILTNTSQNSKLKFTIKTTIEREKGNKTSIISFQELEPGEEKVIGKSVNFIGEKYYSKQLFDTIKEYTHFDQIIKSTKSSIKISKELSKFKNKKYVYTPDYVKTYTKNNIDYNPNGDGNGIVFWGADWKKIDSIKKGQIQIITYLMPSELISDTTKPKKQEKIIYSYEIKGQRSIH